jgi:hypothetical protein
MPTVKRDLLTMDRSGQFHVWAYGSAHCGVDQNLLIKYALTCECAAKLDKRGFLFDQINVDNYFKGIVRTKLSCEKLTIKCTKELIQMIVDENPACKILRMDLTLSPAPHAASMKYSWVSNEN